MANDSPLVSVLMTAYNRERLIGEAVDSVLSSTLRDFELIIVDDCSSDRTAEVARAFESRDPRVRVAVNERNLGDYQNRNQAASLARGTYIKYLDSDDMIYPHGLEVMVRCMSAYPDAGFGLSALPDAAGPCPQFLTPADGYRQNFFGLDLFGRAPGSAIIRRTAFQDVGGFSGQRQVGDHELWLRMARRFAMVKMPMDLVWDRQHEAQEKNYDGIVEKALMHEKVQFDALRAPNCPLDEGERDAALARLTSNRARNFWLLMRSPRGVSLARDYRKKTDLSAADIAKVAWKRIWRGGAHDHRTSSNNL